MNSLIDDVRYEVTKSLTSIYDLQRLSLTCKDWYKSTQEERVWIVFYNVLINKLKKLDLVFEDYPHSFGGWKIVPLFIRDLLCLERFKEKPIANLAMLKKWFDIKTLGSIYEVWGGRLIRSKKISLLSKARWLEILKPYADIHQIIRSKGDFLSVKNSEIIDLPNLSFLFPFIEDLRLDGNPLDSLPETFKQFTILKVLFIQRNEFKTITNLPLSIEELYIGYNPLSTVPNEIANLDQLTYLNMDKCQLKSLPDFICNLLELKNLSISNNEIEQLPQALDNLSNLSFLNVGGNPLKNFPRCFFNLRKLETLTLPLDFQFDDDIVSLIEEHPGITVRYTNDLINYG